MHPSLPNSAEASAEVGRATRAVSRCVWCGHDLSGLTGAVCPECGKEVPRADLRHLIGHCPACDYDLSRAEGPRCPECGLERTPVNLGDPIRIHEFQSAGPRVTFIAYLMPVLILIPTGPFGVLVVLAVYGVNLLGLCVCMPMPRRWGWTAYQLWLRMSWRLHVAWVWCVLVLLATMFASPGGLGTTGLVLGLGILPGAYYAVRTGVRWKGRWQAAAVRHGLPDLVRARSALPLACVVLVAQIVVCGGVYAAFVMFALRA